MKNKNCSDKRLNSDSGDGGGQSESGHNNDRSTHHSKQSKSNSHHSKVSSVGLLPSSSSSSSVTSETPTRSSITMPSTSHTHLSYSRSRSKSSVSYLESKIKNKISHNLNELPLNLDNSKLIQTNASSNISSSLINAFQMPQMSQVFPNINMSSLPDYLTQLPSVSMPSMPNISIPTLTMPSIPNLSMPSMPNLSMPNISMPSMPNINIPSISDIMSFPGRKQIKSWSEICLAVRDSRKRYTDVCSSLPFSFNSCYDEKREILRLYFLSSGNSSETTLYYCDVPLDKQPPKISMEYSSGGTRGVFQIDEEMSQEDANDNEDSSTDNNNVQSSALNLHQFDHFDGTSNKQETPVPFRNIDFEENYDNFDSSNNFNLKSSSSSLSSISISSSSDSSDSLVISQIDSSMFRKSITSPSSSIENLETLEWKPLILMNKSYFTTYNNEENSFESVTKATPNRPLNSFAKPNSLPLSNNKTSSSQEEDLILQRKRILFNGIVSYDFHPTVARFVFTIKNIIYWFDDLEITHKENCNVHQCQPLPTEINSFQINSEKQRPSPPPYIPHKLMTNTYVKMNATMCPHNSDLVAYVADSDLWVCDLVSCKEMRITSTDYSKTAITAGRPSFVMQEEFSRFNGFWWKPDSGDVNSDTYTILCEFVDESMVESVSISSWDGQTEVHRFPKAGCRNAKSTLKLIHFSSNDLKTMSKVNNNIKNVKIESLTTSFETIFPEYEYLVRCGWYSHDVVWAQLLNRCQNNVVIVLVSISNKFPSQIILEEVHDNHWYNCHDVIHFYHNQSDIVTNGGDETNNVNCDLTVGSTVKFLWSSELTGYRHLYKNTVTIVGFPDKEQHEEMDLVTTITPVNGTNSSIDLNEKNDCSKNEILTNLKHDFVRLKSSLVFNQQITNGNWEVSESLFWVDEKSDLIYFVGNKDSPLESHLYVVSSSQSLRVLPRRLTKEDFSHSRIYFDPNFMFCIDFQSNLTIPPFAYLHQIVKTDHTPQLANLEPVFTFLGLPDGVSLSDESMEYYDKVQSLGPTPQLFEYKLKSGELIYGFLFKPDFMEPGVKYPVLLEIYGGPEVQFVTKSFKDVRQHRRHLIASEGYIVVGFDSRGSKHRGVDFERHIYKRLGQVEIYDQVEALQWLALNTGFIDMSRVAIHGWSYGGYLSLMALAQRPDIFKCAIAGAPVTNWHLYDTGYTERYMGLPEDNEEGYRLSSVLTYIKHFPHEYNRLLIIHGLMDENVHFAHTAQLIHGLIMAGKPYNLNVFPFERHSLRKMHSSEHYEATLVYYLQQNL